MKKIDTITNFPFYIIIILSIFHFSILAYTYIYCICRFFFLFYFIFALFPKGKGKCKKNILMIVVDDLRPALGTFNSSFMKTPNIDQLASQSTLYKRTYAQVILLFFMPFNDI